MRSISEQNFAGISGSGGDWCRAIVQEDTQHPGRDCTEIIVGSLARSVQPVSQDHRRRSSRRRGRATGGGRYEQQNATSFVRSKGEDDNDLGKWPAPSFPFSLDLAKVPQQPMKVGYSIGTTSGGDSALQRLRNRLKPLLHPRYDEYASKGTSSIAVPLLYRSLIHEGNVPGFDQARAVCQPGSSCSQRRTLTAEPMKLHPRFP